MDIYEETFWLVWNPNGFNPKIKHNSLKSAKEEAMRLAIKHPTWEFYVLETKGKACLEDNIYQDTEQLPF